MNRSDLESLAGLLRVNPVVLEKVTRLLEILERLDKQDGVRDRYALKGGTALNLFVLPLPRLSVDIDLNFVHACGPAQLELASRLCSSRRAGRPVDRLPVSLRFRGPRRREATPSIRKRVRGRTEPRD